MDLPPHIENYIKQTIDDTLGISVPPQTLAAKLRATQESQLLLRDQNLSLLAKLNHKDQLVQRLKSESDMNARALKKFVEENNRLASECENLVAECQKWEHEIALYEHDRDALMEFGNEADERARESQSRVLELEKDLNLLEDELNKYKHHHESVDSSSGTPVEENLLDSVLATFISNDDDSAYAFLVANSGNESCKQLLSMWNCIKPSTRSVLSLIAKVKSLEKDKEHLTTNLHKAEEEVKLLFEENIILDEKNKKILKQLKEGKHPGSGGKHTSSASAKSNKRKTSPRTTSPMERKIDFGELESARQPLSPLRHNSPDCRMVKK
ncbi:uncharacterized protein LOC130718316 [Lotus japonicus]|uniref:uncharacterized protein LOC130718316 n=1 Tax=Lotus japonicus TaxID=34305 RepID=UPI002585D315|nr:uncharacterized protein LOC130718316 [Lotus japonicus]